MLLNWSEWKRFPDATRGDDLQAPIGPGIFEVRHISSGALFAFGATDQVAQALSQIALKPRSIASLFVKRDPLPLKDLEYRTCAAATKIDAKLAAERMIGRRDTYMRGAA
jgi:hypothetical protein